MSPGAPWHRWGERAQDEKEIGQECEGQLPREQSGWAERWGWRQGRSRVGLRVGENRERVKLEKIGGTSGRERRGEGTREQGGRSGVSALAGYLLALRLPPLLLAPQGLPVLQPPLLLLLLQLPLLPLAPLLLLHAPPLLLLLLDAALPLVQQLLDVCLGVPLLLLLQLLLLL